MANRSRSLVLACAAGLLLMPSQAIAAAGALDPTFSDDGKTTTTHVIDTDEIAEDVVVQPDGRIVVVGWRSDFDTGLSSTVVLRYLEDGTPDPGFGGGDGIVELPLGSARGFAVALLSDDRIAIAGTVQVDITDFEFAAFLLTPAGDLDSTFSGDGVSVISFGNDIDLAYGIDIDASDRIVLGGRVDDPFVGMRMAVVRLTPDGIPDPSFSLDGRRTIAFAGTAQARDVEIQSNGRIVLAGQRQATIGFTLARLLPGGALDTTFGGDGRTVNNAGYGANAISIQSDGKVVAAGYGLGSSIDFMLQRYRLNGSLDPTFSRDGIVRTNFSGFEDIAWDVEVQSNGKILAVGHAEVNRQLRFGVVRYRPSGIRDLTFSGDGKSSKVPGPAYGSTLDAAHRLVVVGTINLGFGTARYLLN